MTKHIHNILFSVITIFNLSVSNAQRYIGINGGFSKGTFMNFSKKENYDASYQWKDGIMLSSFYETKIDSNSNLKIELQYRRQNVNMEITNTAGNASFYRNLKYSSQLLGLNLTYSFRFIEKKRFTVYFVFGPTFSYNLNTASKGNGWEFHYKNQIDTNGNHIGILSTNHWEKKENHSKDISTFNFGLDTGFDLVVPINSRIDFMLGNRYNVFLSNVTTLNKLRYTSLLTGYLCIGIRHSL